MILPSMRVKPLNLDASSSSRVDMVTRREEDGHAAGTFSRKHLLLFVYIYLFVVRHSARWPSDHNSPRRSLCPPPHCLSHEGLDDTRRIRLAFGAHLGLAEGWQQQETAQEVACIYHFRLPLDV